MPDKIAHYELLTPLGVGGMGEVYRAKDTRLDREVAIKFLPDLLAKDPERIARFDREAKTLASLHHPNIATVHDFMTVDGKSFLVMELVEGEELAKRLEQGPIPADETRQLAIQLATGLEAAHERNIVHRDLKPANIKITPDGQLKILDFGLARAVTGDPEDQSDPMLSPTITQAMTQAGTILGTAAYMSPEQARGKPVDKRADIWAFGVLLYEMLTGERLFEGETTSDTLASVLKNPVDFDELDQEIPADMLWVLQRCLDRNPTRRLRDIGEARLILSGDSTVSQIGMKAVDEPTSKRTPILWPALAILLAVALAVSFLIRPEAKEAPQIRASIPMPDGAHLLISARQPGPPMISPDGQALVFAAQDEDGETQLWYRRLDSPNARALDGTDGASYPFWSPDSKSVAYFSDSNLWRLDIGTGSPLRLAELSFGKGGSWNQDGTIVFAPSYNSTLSRIAAGGGDLPRSVTEFDSIGGENSHRHPFFLPDGNHFLYLARGASDSSRSTDNSIRVGSLDGGVGVYVGGADGHAEFHDGRLLFARDGALVVQSFDPAAARLTGDPRVLLPGIESLGAAVRTVVSVSQTGIMVYVEPSLAVGHDRVTRINREGNVVGSIGEPASINAIRMSPDGLRAAVVEGDASVGNSRIWIMDLERGTKSRFASGGGNSYAPVWSPDSRYLAYVSVDDENDTWRILVRRVDGGGSPVQLVESRDFVTPESWSPDGTKFTYAPENDGIWLIPVTPEGKATGEARPIVVEGEGSEWGSCFIGNSDWIVYHSSRPGTFELFVTHVDDASRRFQITSTGAIFASYNRATREISWSALGTDQLSVVKVIFPEADSDPVFGTPESLFRLPRADIDYAVDFQGQELLIGLGPESGKDSVPRLITDWRKLLVD
jgi:serine/threonine protein kinase